MKFFTRTALFIMVLALLIFILKSETFTINKKIINNISLSSSKIINSYDKFYGALNDFITMEKKTATLKILKYNSKTYNLSKVLDDKSKEGIETNTKKTKTIVGINNVYDSILIAIKSGEGSITFSYNNAKKTTFDAFKNTANKVIEENPEFRYFNSWDISYSSIGNDATYKVKFNLNFKKDEIVSMQNSLNKKINMIVNSEIKPNMSDYEKELALHDYLVNNSTYDYKNYLKRNIPAEDYTAYGVLVKGTGVCEGYAYAMKKLLNKVGIKCEVIVGDATGISSGPHAWNIVKLGSKYYHLDATFDDPIFNGGKEQVLRHNYFNLDDKEMLKDHNWKHTKYPECNGTIYKYHKGS